MKLIKKMYAVALIASMMLSATASSGLASASYTAGTYTGKAKGMKGDVVVDVTFDSNSITSIQIVSQQETPGISDAAFETIPEAIIKNQSLGIEAVSGATVSSNAILAAVSETVIAAGGDVEALKNVAVHKDEVAKDIEETADVIVVGGGGAGMATAVSAAQEGLSVIVIEANAYLGGNTVRSAGAMSVADVETTGQHDMNETQEKEIIDLLSRPTDKEEIKKLQEVSKAQYEEFKKGHPGKLFDSVEFNTLQLYFRFDEATLIDQLYFTVNQSKETKDWLTSLGFPWAEESHVVIGDVWPRWNSSSKHKSGIAYIEVFEEAIENENLPVKIYKNARGKSLITDETGRVTGVHAVGKDGSTYTLHGNKGVVLATGGFSANNDMMVEYSDGRWKDLAHIGTTNDPSCVGDGIVMAKEVGAQLYNMGHVQIMPIADPVTGYTDTLVGASTNMFVNIEGKRFVNESADRDTLVNAILEQPESSLYIISSQECCGIDENGLNVFGRSIDDLIEDGKVLVADSIPELAEKMGIEPAVLEETVSKFNKAVQEQNDPEFNRPSFTGDIGNIGGTPEIISAPYYACLRKPAAHITKGGVRITNDGHVLAENNEIIPGLFAAGEVTGDIGAAGLMQANVQGYTLGKTLSNQN